MLAKDEVRVIEIILLIVAIVLIVIVARYLPLPDTSEYIPDAVKGLTTVISVLAGFTGFCLTFSITSTRDEETRKFVKKRVPILGFFILIGLLSLCGAYGSLIWGDLFESYRIVVSIAIATVWIFFESILLLMVE